MTTPHLPFAVLALGLLRVASAQEEGNGPAPWVIEKPATADYETFVATARERGWSDPRVEIEEALGRSPDAWRAELEQAETFHAEILAENEVDEDPARRDRVEGALDRIRPHCPWPDGVVEIRPVVLAGDVPNAYSTLGGRIYVTTAILEAVDDDELVFVLAHELAHQVAGHLGRKLALCLRLEAAADLADDSREDVLRRYSRILEAEADALALLWVRRTATRVDAPVTLMRIFDRIEAERVDEALRARGELRQRRIALDRARWDRVMDWVRDGTSPGQLHSAPFDPDRTRVDQEEGLVAAEIERIVDESLRTHPRNRARIEALAREDAPGDPVSRYVSELAGEPR